MADIEKSESPEQLEFNEDSTYPNSVDLSSVDEKALIRKIDWRLIPVLSILYLLSFLDRTAIGDSITEVEARSY
jgi:hypothetical protein